MTEPDRPARATPRAGVVVALVVAGLAVVLAVAGPPLAKIRVAAEVSRLAERRGLAVHVAPGDVEVWLDPSGVTFHDLAVTGYGVSGRLDVSMQLGSWLDVVMGDLGGEDTVLLHLGPGKLHVRAPAAPAVEATPNGGALVRASGELPRVGLSVDGLDVETPAGWLRNVRGNLQPSFERPITLNGWICLEVAGKPWCAHPSITADEVRIGADPDAPWRSDVPGLGPVDVWAGDLVLVPRAARAVVRDVRATVGPREVRAERVEVSLAGDALLAAASGVAVDDDRERLPFSAARIDVQVPLSGRLTRLVVPRLEATVDWDAVAPFVRAHLGGAATTGAAAAVAPTTSESPKGPLALEIQDGRVELAGAGLALGALKVDAARDHLDLSGEVRSAERAEGTVVLGWKASGEAPASLRVDYQGCLPPAPWRALLAENGLTISPGCHDSLTLDAALGADEVTFAGKLGVAAWTVQEAHLASESMADIGFDAVFDGRLRRDLSEGLLRLASFTSGPLTLSGSLSGTRLRDKPVFDLVVDVPSQACDNLLRALPEAMRPDLEGLWLGGTFRLKLRYTVDLARVYTMYDARLAGREEPYTSPLVVEGENLCEVTSSPRGIDIQALNRADFVHRVELEDGRQVEVGPGTSSYVPLGDLPQTVVQGALATEDLSFYGHRGVNPGLLKTALEMDLHAGRFKYGGSTITQQLVKNLFLSRTKTIARKIEDILLALIVETVVSKDRLLELYLNVIEFGDGVYGIRNASLTYFGKEPRELLPEEAAFLMTCKPAPPDCQRLLDRGAVTPAWRVKIDYVLERLYRRVKVIGEKEYTDALARDIRFLGSGAGAAPAAAPGATGLSLDLLP